MMVEGIIAVLEGGAILRRHRKLGLYDSVALFHEASPPAVHQINRPTFSLSLKRGAINFIGGDLVKLLDMVGLGARFFFLAQESDCGSFRGIEWQRLAAHITNAGNPSPAHAIRPSHVHQPPRAALTAAINSYGW
jgi:hypothetical protein